MERAMMFDDAGFEPDDYVPPSGTLDANGYRRLETAPRVVVAAAARATQADAVAAAAAPAKAAPTFSNGFFKGPRGLAGQAAWQALPKSCMTMYLFLLDKRDPRLDEVFVLPGSVREELRMHEQTAWAALRRLVKDGFIAPVGKYVPGHRVQRYRLVGLSETAESKVSETA